MLENIFLTLIMISAAANVFVKDVKPAERLDKEN